MKVGEVAEEIPEAAVLGEWRVAPLGEQAQGQGPQAAEEGGGG